MINDTQQKKSTKDILGFNDFWLWLLGIPIVSAVMPIAFFAVDPFHDPDIFFHKAMVCVFFVTIHWQVDRQIILFYRRKYPASKDHLKRIFRQSFAILLFLISFCTLSKHLLSQVIAKITSQAPPSLLQLLFSSLVITVAILAIYETILTIQLWKKDIVQTEKLKKENFRSQLEALKNQVNPHFLFNSLNTLSATIHDNPDLAVKFTQNLSKVYRYILDTKHKELVLLEQELEAIQHYIFLLEARFGEKLNVSIRLNDLDKKKYIVPLSLQMLLENAIKHNVVSQAKPLFITIEKHEDDLIVKNNLQVKDQSANSTKTGLSNIRKRYQLLVEKDILVKATANHFIVVIPLIEIVKYESTDH